MEHALYKIFISHTEVDSPIAAAVRRVLSDAFTDFIELHLAVEDNEIGISWKEELQKRLKSFDALITIITPEAVEKPWIYVEWSPFWINNKDYYILTHGEISNEKMFAPMNDRQTGKILDRANVVSLFRRLHHACGAEASGKHPPIELVDTFLTEVVHGIEMKQTHKYGIYRKTLDTLPPSDRDKRQIAEYFYRAREYDVFLEVVKRIESDDDKSDIASTILADSETDPRKELELAAGIASFLDSSEKIRRIAVCLIDRGAIDTPEMHQIVQILAEMARTELKRLSEYLIKKGMDDTSLFNEMVHILAEDAPVELRNLACSMVRNDHMDRSSFSLVVDTIIAQEKYQLMIDLATQMLKQRIHRANNWFFLLIATVFASGRRKVIKPFFRLFVIEDRAYAKEILLLLMQTENQALAEELLNEFGLLE